MTVTKLEKVPTFPINIDFSADAPQKFSTLAALWMEDQPQHHQINDDVINMYNETSRVACFQAARRHRPCRMGCLK